MRIFGLNNFYNEPRPMETLLKLGSSVPFPAVGDCFTAALCVRLGNRYGQSWAAQEFANVFLTKVLRTNQWEYYLNKLLPYDRYILEKLAGDGKPLDQWMSLVSESGLIQLSIDPLSAKLVTTDKAKRSQIRSSAESLRLQVMQ